MKHFLIPFYKTLFFLMKKEYISFDLKLYFYWSMRLRSNAIHSQSQQEFMMLAEFSHQRPGYFYDEKFRAEVNRKMNKHKQGLMVAKEPIKDTDFNGFDYSPQQQEKKQEQTQISQPSKRKQYVLTVIVNQVEQATSTLHSYYGSQETRQQNKLFQQQERLLDLYTIEHQQTLVKIWLIKCSQVNNILMQPYLTRTRTVINLSEEINDFQKQLSIQIRNAMQDCMGSE